MRELMIYLINMCEVLISDVTSSDVSSREVTSCDATCNVTRHDVKRCADTCHDADCILHNLVSPPPPSFYRTCVLPHIISQRPYTKQITLPHRLQLLLPTFPRAIGPFCNIQLPYPGP